MKIGDLVIHKKFKGSIGIVKHKCTWPRKDEVVWDVYWFYHYYDTGRVSPIYDFEVEVINEDR